MAKRKKQKESKKGFQYSNEILGLILILLSITGIGSFGMVGGIIKKFAIFMFGSWSILFLGLIFMLGVSMIARRGKVNYFSGRMIGVYSLVIALLLFSHINYIEGNEIVNAREILKVTMDNIVSSFEINTEINTGGGMIGALVSWLFVSLFDVEGTMVVMVAIIVFGLIMIFDLTLTDIVSAIISPFKNMFSSSDDDEDEEEDDKSKKKLD